MISKWFGKKWDNYYFNTYLSEKQYKITEIIVWVWSIIFFILDILFIIPELIFIFVKISFKIFRYKESVKND